MAVLLEWVFRSGREKESGREEDDDGMESKKQKKKEVCRKEEKKKISYTAQVRRTRRVAQAANPIQTA